MVQTLKEAPAMNPANRRIAFPPVIIISDCSGLVGNEDVCSLLSSGSHQD